MNFPFSEYLMLSSEGIFVIWETLAEFAANIFTLKVGWDIHTAWVGTGTLIYFLCRYFKKISPAFIVSTGE